MAEELKKLHRKNAFLVFFLISISVFVLVSLFIHDHAISEIIDKSTHDMIVNSLQDQVMILKWVGTAMVGSMAAAILVLWRTILRQQRVVVDEMRSATTGRTEAVQIAEEVRQKMTRLAGSVERLEKKIEECPTRHQWTAGEGG